MPVTNATFDFQGTDVTTDTNISAGGIQSGTLTEQGITFSFTSDAGNANFSGTNFNLSVSEGTATLTIDGPPSEEFFSDLVFNFGPSVGGSHSIMLLRTKTDNGAPGSTATATITAGQIATSGTVAAPAGKWNAIQFKASGTAGSDFLTLNSITSTVNCFLSGTLIATEAGETPVEALKPGDLLRTADGRLTPVTWLGHFNVDTRLQHPAKVNPVRITAGALGNGLPKRDLHLSLDHAIELGGVLYNAGALVNGRSIYQVTKMPTPGFTYYHVETEAHELLLAEGVEAESFIDYAGRDTFDNAAEAKDRLIAEMDRPRVSAARLVPDTLRVALLARAGAPDAKAA